MGVPRGTTPVFRLTFEEEELDLTTARNVYVTFKAPVKLSPYKSAYKVLTKTGDDLEVSEKEVLVYLSQLETLEFPEGNVKIQANWTTAEGNRIASGVVTYPMTEQLLLKVVE